MVEDVSPATDVSLQSQRLHPDILKLGLVSFLTDLSSEMIFSVFAIVHLIFYLSWQDSPLLV